LAMKPAAKLAASAFAKGSAWGTAMAGVLGGASHATVTAGIGLVRENTLSVLNGLNQTQTGREFLKNQAKWFGGYFLGDVVGNILLDTMIPMARGMGLAFLPKAMGQNAAAFKGVDEKTLLGIITDYMDGKDIDPYLLQRLPAAAQLSFQNLKISRAVMNNLPGKTDAEIFTMLANQKGYVVGR